MEITRIYYNVALQGPEAQPAFFRDGTPFNPLATLDGNPILSGERIPLGKHTFTITHPNTETYSTNLSIWYGPHNLGTIDLKRAKGMLSVTASPPAPLLFIQGPEFGVTLTNSSGINTFVPTDEYTITARYDHWQEQHSLKVLGNIGGQLKIAPMFGVLELTCSQKEASFQLNRPNGTLVQLGDFPILIRDLPQDTYQIVTWHHNHKWVQDALVVAGMTNSYRVELQYGTAVLETTPAGARVATPDGRELGTTPLTLSELRPGNMQFVLELNNYEPRTVSLEIAANRTNSFRTNLISQSYTSSMRAARQSMNAGAYDDASRFLTDALRAQPDDAAATALLQQATGLGSIARAGDLGKQGDYVAGSKELEKALTALPDNAQAKEMLADFKQHEPEQLARQERENSDALTNVFNAFTDKITGATPVEVHELKTSKPAREVQSAITNLFHTLAPAFDLTRIGWTNEIFYMDANQEVSGGGRLCMIVGGPIKDGETRIMFKVIEYKSEAVGLKILGSVLAAATSTTYRSSYHAIDPSDPKISESDKNRVAEGTRIVTERIQHAVGQ